jgi:hypothetical protein
MDSSGSSGATFSHHWESPRWMPGGRIISTQLGGILSFPIFNRPGEPAHHLHHQSILGVSCNEMHSGRRSLTSRGPLGAQLCCLHGFPIKWAWEESLLNVLPTLYLQTLSRWMLGLAPFISFSHVFFFGLMANFLWILHPLVFGSSPIVSSLIGNWGTQSITCYSFHDSGITGGKSPCLYVNSCHFFFKLWNCEQLSHPCILVSTMVGEQLTYYHVYLNT